MTTGRLPHLHSTSRLGWYHLQTPAYLARALRIYLALAIQGATTGQGKTSASSSQSMSLSCFKNILFPGIMNQYLPLYSHLEQSLSPANWTLWLTKQVPIIHKLLHSGCYIQAPGQVLFSSRCIPRAMLTPFPVPTHSPLPWPYY